jgi:hypothetical protein
MKRFFIILLMLVGIATICFPQTKTMSEKWSALSHENKINFMAGFLSGCVFLGSEMYNLPANIRLDDNTKYALSNYLNSYTEVMDKENMKYWVAAIDAYYAVKTNKENTLNQALKSVIDAYVSGKNTK